MTTQMDSFISDIQSIRVELSRLLDGIDYCFDWKPEDGEWSAREVVYHVADTPSGGLHVALQRVLEKSIEELPITSSLTNLTDERRLKDLDNVRQDVEAVLAGLEGALASTTDAQLKETTVRLHSISRSTIEDRTAQELMERAFVGHWREHLGQLAALREMLGLD